MIRSGLVALQRQGDALADADAHGGERRFVPRSRSSSAAVPAMRAPDMPSGWPSAIAPPFGLTCASSSAMPSCAQHGDALAGEGFVELDHVEVGRLESQPRAEFLRRRHRADAHDAGRNAGRRATKDPRDRGEPVVLRRRLRGDDQRRRAVVDARSVAGGDRAALAERRRQLGQRLDAWSARGCSSCSTTTGSPFRCGIVTGTISCASRPFSCAAAAFAWLRSAKRLGRRG